MNIIRWSLLPRMRLQTAVSSGSKRWWKTPTRHSFPFRLVSGGEVIGVINVHHRDPHHHTADEISLLTFVGEQMGGAISKSLLAEQNARLQEETAEMRRQLETRKIVERAKGILQHRHALTEEEAYLRLRNESRRLRRPMRELAEAIILSEDLSRKSETLQ